MELTIIETSAYQELRRLVCTLAVQMGDFQKKIAPPAPDKWMDAQDVCLALGISKTCLQNYRDNGLIPYSNIGGKFFYREVDIQEILESGLIRRK